MMDRTTTIVFRIGFGLCLALIGGLCTMYFIQFNGVLSEKIEEWSDFSNFIYGISTVALTTLNVYLFYKLTSSANRINSMSHDISTGIIKVYTLEEKKRSKAHTGVTLMQEYKNAQDELMSLLDANHDDKVDYKAVRVSACKLESTYKILHDSNQIFPSLYGYPKHEEYLEELNAIITQSKEGRPQGNMPKIEFFQYRAIPDIQNHDETILNYYEEIMSRIQKDLGKVYAIDEQNNG